MVGQGWQETEGRIGGGRKDSECSAVVPGEGICARAITSIGERVRVPQADGGCSGYRTPQSVTTTLKPKVIPLADKTPGKRCSDYDSDCAKVVSHYHCWLGDNEDGGWPGWNLGPADGYCPFLLGIE